MKKLFQIFGRCIAIVCTACISISSGVVTAHAEDRTFPSGKSITAFEDIMEKISNNNTNSAEDIPAFSYIVFHSEETLDTFCYGQTDMENHVYADENTVYDWGSISKTMVWVSVMQLWEQNKLDLNEDIRTYLPNDFFQHLSYDDPITMLDLMNHEGGWCEPAYRSYFHIGEEEKIPTLEEALRASEPAQVYRPGEVTAYSNWGAALAGYIVEYISGMNFSDYVHQNIFEPLGMEHTSIAADLSDNPWVKEQRQKVMAYELNSEYSPLESNMEYDALYPCGSATGTIGDLAIYAKSLVNDDAPLFQNKETQEKLFSGSAFYGNSDVPSCSYGFWVSEYDNARVYSHSGFSGYCVADMQFDPVSKYGFVSLTNHIGGAIPLNMFIFDSLSADSYPSVSDDRPDVDGYYVNTRYNAAGPLKIGALLYTSELMYAAQFNNEEHLEVSCIGDGFYKITNDNGQTEMLFSEKHYADGGKGIHMGSVEYRPDRFYLAKLCLLTGYFMVAAASFFILLVRRKLKKVHKLPSCTGAGVLTLGQAAKILSVLSLITLIAFHSRSDTLVLPPSVIVSTCVIQILCVTFCIIAAVVSVCVLIIKRPAKLYLFQYAGSFAGNTIAIAAIVCFELYRFWGC